MTAEKGICPKTGEVCAVRLACEESIEAAETILSTHKAFQEWPFQRITRVILRRLRKDEEVEAFDAFPTRVEKQKREQEAYLILNCVGDDCIVRDAAERDGYDIELALESRDG